MAFVRCVVKNRWFNLCAAIIFFYSGFSEAYETLAEDLLSGNFGAHHGMMLLGIIQLLKVLPDMIEGTESLSEAGKE